jgi:transcription antitermination factor NusG
MGNLDLSQEYQHLVEQSRLAHHRTLSRYGSRDQIDPLPPGAGFWFAVCCRGGKERLASEGLKLRNFEVYLPVLYVKERHGRYSMREVIRPMFSTYLFIRCLPRSDHWERARNVPGVQVFIQSLKDDQNAEFAPQYIPEPVMDTIRLAEACHATKTGRKALRWKLQVGDEARVKTGPFADFYATVTSAIDDHGRVMALVSIFGRSSRVQFDADDLQKL